MIQPGYCLSLVIKAKRHFKEGLLNVGLIWPLVWNLVPHFTQKTD